MAASAWFGVTLLVIGILLFVCYSRTGKMLRCIFFTATSGSAALGVLWAVGNVIGLNVGVTPFSLLASAILGIPGVLAMLLLALI